MSDHIAVRIVNTTGVDQEINTLVCLGNAEPGVELTRHLVAQNLLLMNRLMLSNLCLMGLCVAEVSVIVRAPLNALVGSRNGSPLADLVLSPAVRIIAHRIEQGELNWQDDHKLSFRPGDGRPTGNYSGCTEQASGYWSLQTNLYNSTDDSHSRRLDSIAGDRSQ